MAPATMKAIQIQQYNEPYHISDVPIPKPKPHQVLVRIQAAGFCHTDLMALNNEFNTKLPFIGSHEPAGIIEEVGSEVTGFQRGDRVGCINFDSVCGELQGAPIDDVRFISDWFKLVDARFLVKLPDDMEFKVAAPLMCAGIMHGKVIFDVIVGILNQLAKQLRRTQGYKVAAIDVKQSALDAVASYEHYPDVLILATDTVEKSLEKIDGVTSSEYSGLDATVLATDHPAAFELAAALTRKHGTMVLLGQPEKGITMSYQTVIYKDIKLVGSLVADTAQAQELVELFHRNRLHVEITEWKMEEAEQMRQWYCSGASSGKNVIVMD
ncbi:unnamed protein product [Aspergillus oryzae]|nr:unnamed protein product [Aspergillus oryzae]